MTQHAGPFVFHAGVTGDLKHTWAWPVAQVQAILNLDGKVTMSISDQGAMQLTVHSGLAEYNYIPQTQNRRCMTSVDERDSDATWENEQSMVTIPLKEYDKLREKQKYITDRDMIAVIDKIEELVRALRKHIIRSRYLRGE